MNRAYISIATRELPHTTDAELLGQLAARLPFALEPAQRAAWEYQIKHLRELAGELPDAHFFMEFLIPRMGRRADLVVILEGIVFVVEYKLGAHQFDRSSVDQVYGYGLDLKHFHETSHTVPIVPILIAIYSGTAGNVNDGWVGYNPVKGPGYGQETILGGAGQILANATPANAAPANAAPVVQANPQQQYEDAFANYRNSTGYQFRVNEGQDAINSGYAAGGTLRSGAALKSLENYRQGVASSEFNNYLNSLFNVSNLGLSAAGAQAGVSTNYANTVGANNNASAAALGNAALLRGQTNANLYGTVGNALGNLGGSIFASSFGGVSPSLNAASQQMIAANPGIF